MTASAFDTSGAVIVAGLGTSVSLAFTTVMHIKLEPKFYLNVL
jgi:hypothetical protein